MIFTLSDTDTHEIARTLVEIRDDGSQGTTSRVLTLIAVAKDTDNIPVSYTHLTLPTTPYV